MIFAMYLTKPIMFGLRFLILFFLCHIRKHFSEIINAIIFTFLQVYSDVLRKWIHCDPCENKINTPLMYEKGWNKSLSYVIAFSSYEVQDVTWRYTTKYSEIIQRRTLSSEENLIRYMLILSKKL